MCEEFHITDVQHLIKTFWLCLFYKREAQTFKEIYFSGKLYYPNSLPFNQS